VAPQDSQICGGNFPKRKKIDRRVVPNTYMVTMEIVINSIRVMGIRVTISCRLSIAFEAMLLFLFFFVIFFGSKAGAPCVRRVHSLNKHFVAVYRQISTRFQPFFTRIALSDTLHGSRFCRYVAPQVSRIYGRNFSKRKKSAVDLCQILRMTTLRAS